jgi:hypothetical protein
MRTSSFANNTNNNYDVPLSLALAQREGHLGIGARQDPGQNSKPEMDPRVNPLQLTGSANGGTYASATDLKGNILASLNFFASQYSNSKSIEEKLGHYNDGGNIGTKGKEYAADVLKKMQAIKTSTFRTRGYKTFSGVSYPF